jgi:hypothetical protein
MIKMIATTINNSISEKPFCFCLMSSPVDSNLNFNRTIQQGHRRRREAIFANSLPTTKPGK